MTETKYESFVPDIYREMKMVLDQYAIPGSKILDIGAFEGNLESYLDSIGNGKFEIEAIDIDGPALNVLRAKKFENIRVNATEIDANEYIEKCENTFDIALSSASIHEINNPENQEKYLDWFFTKIDRILNPNGIVIVGDLYFPDHVSDEVVEAFQAYQFATINHASERKQFIKPELIDAVASRNGFQLIMKKEIRAVKQIDRRYYVIVLKKI